MRGLLLLMCIVAAPVGVGIATARPGLWPLVAAVGAVSCLVLYLVARE
jgi:hypothetical protein